MTTMNIVTLTTNEDGRKNSDSPVNRVFNYPMETILLRYEHKNNVPCAEVARHERELKRYLALCVANPDAIYGMVDPIDQLWHEFILFTRIYADFCQSAAGYFIHHIPRLDLVKNLGKTPGDLDVGYRRFLDDYQTVFGEAAPADLWPRNAVPSSCNGCSNTNCSCQS